MCDGELECVAVLNIFQISRRGVWLTFQDLRNESIAVVGIFGI